MLTKELHKTVEKLERSGDLSSGAIEYLDKLTHSIKSIKTIMAMEESGYSRRDSRGRYARDEYSASPEYAEAREVIDRIPDEHIRREMERSLARMANS